jgi:hypothetical protein
MMLQKRLCVGKDMYWLRQRMRTYGMGQSLAVIDCTEQSSTLKVLMCYLLDSSLLRYRVQDVVL